MGAKGLADAFPGAARRVVVVVVASVVGLGGASAWAAQGQKPRCSARHVLARTANVLVYEQAGNKRDAIGLRETGVYVCMRPRGGPSLLGYNDINGAHTVYGPDHRLLGIPEVGGSYVVAQFLQGENAVDACEKFNGGAPNAPCPPATLTVRVVKARGGRSATFAPVVAGGASSATSNLIPGPVPIAVSAAGAIAWVDGRGLLATRLRPRGKKLQGSPQVLDPNASGLISVSGLTVNWYDVVNGTQVDHSATVPGG